MTPATTTTRTHHATSPLRWTRAAWIACALTAITAAQPRPSGNVTEGPPAPTTAPAGPATDDVMAKVGGLMDKAQKRLIVSLDPGPETQQTQQQILAALDEAITQALSGRIQPVPPPPSKGDRRKDKTQQQAQSQQQQQQAGTTPADERQTAVTGTVEGDPEASLSSGALREYRRGWGHLPERDRDEIIQGIREHVLEKYRDQIERYYRALADTADDSPATPRQDGEH